MEDLKFYEETSEERVIEAMRAFCSSKASISKDKLKIRENGKVVQVVDIRDLYLTLEKRIAQFYDIFISQLDNLENQGYSLNIDENEKRMLAEGSTTELDYGYSNFASIILTYQKSINTLKTNTKMYSDFEKNISSYIEKLRQRMSKYDFSRYVLYSSIMALNDSNAMPHLFDENTTYSVNEAVELMKKFAGRDMYMGNSELTAQALLVMPTDFIRKMEKIGYLDSQKNINISADTFKECDKDLNYESRFLSTKACISAYYYGIMDLEHLKKNFDVSYLFDEELLTKIEKIDLMDSPKKDIAFISLEDKKITYRDHGKMIMEIMDEVEPDNTFSCGFWNYYINGILTDDDIKKLIENGYVYPDEVLLEFMDRHRLAQELGESNKRQQNNETDYSKENDKNSDDIDYIFDDEKLYKIFNADMMALCYSDENIDKMKDIADRYVNKYLKKYYQSHGKDMSDEFMKSVYSIFEKYECGEDEKAKVLMELYDSKIIHANNLKDKGGMDSVIESIIEAQRDNDFAVIDFYNNGLISQESILERYDKDKIIDFINEGINPIIINEFYSIEEVISEMIVSKKLTRICDLSFLRDDTTVDRIKKMYQPIYKTDGEEIDDIIDRLTYDDLAILVIYGIITEEEADKIDQEYDYNFKINMLIEKGILVVGDKYGEKPERNHGERSERKDSGYGPGKIAEEDKQLLYLSLSGEYNELAIESDVLNKYKLVVMPKLKIAMMEPTAQGNGASYIMSIKFALDQICKDAVEDGDEKVDPLKVYGNRTGIRSITGMKVAYHDEQWGYRIKDKIAEIHSNLEELIYSEDTENEKIKHQRDINEVQEEIRKQYLKARCDAKNIPNQNK